MHAAVTRERRARRVELERSMVQAWLCPHCNRTSRDARHVCQHCLQPEPGYASEVRAVPKLSPTTRADPGVRLVTLTSTQRVYRVWVEPVQGVRETGRTDPVDVSTAVAVHTPRSGTSATTSDELVTSAPARSLTVSQVVRAAHTYDPNTPSPTTLSHRPFTHFLSLSIGKLPAARASAERLLNGLRDFTASRDGRRGSRLTPELVQRVPRLHLTLLMLTLETDAAVQLARTLLRDKFVPAWERVKAAAAEPPVVALAGLRVMPSGHNRRADVRHARVVYTAPRDAASQRVVRLLQDTLHEAFAELITDFADAERSKRTPHVTLLNAKWGPTASSQTFDARALLQRFGAEACIGGGEAGTDGLELREVELCRRDTHDAVTQGYVVEDAVPL